MAWPVTIECPTGHWGFQLEEGEGTEEFPMFCPSCGERVEIDMDYVTPENTMTDKI